MGVDKDHGHLYHNQRDKPLAKCVKGTSRLQRFESKKKNLPAAVKRVEQKKAKEKKCAEDFSPDQVVSVKSFVFLNSLLRTEQDTLIPYILKKTGRKKARYGKRRKIRDRVAKEHAKELRHKKKNNLYHYSTFPNVIL